MSKFGWSYEDASNELDRILKSTRTSLGSAQSPENLDLSYHSTTASSCSICGHMQHNPSNTPSHIESRLHHSVKDTPVSGMLDSFRSETPLSRHHYATTSSSSRIHETPPSKSGALSFGTHSSIKKGISPASPSRLSYASSTTRATPKTPDSALITEAKQSATSVVNAFRDLQAKAKIIENERNSAMRIRDELRQELNETRRIQALARNKQETRTHDHYLSIKTSTEELLNSHSQVQREYRRLSEAGATLKDKLSSEYAKQTVLEDDVRRCNSEVQSAEQRILDLKRALLASQGRVDSLEKRLDTDAAAQERAIQAEIRRVQQASEKEHLASVRADIRLGALESYLEIILKVNGDLCEAIRQKEDTDNRAVRLAERQMESSLRTREREVNYILNKAEFIGVSKAMEVSRKNSRFTNPYTMTTSATARGRRRVSFQGDDARRTHSSRRSGVSSRRKGGGGHVQRASVDDSRLHARIYDPQLIEAAARMAATAAATSVVAANSTAHCSACPPKNFIPPSARSNTEFNVIASVSKAAREAKSLNARVASK